MANTPPTDPAVLARGPNVIRATEPHEPGPAGPTTFVTMPGNHPPDIRTSVRLVDSKRGQSTWAIDLDVDAALAEAPPAQIRRLPKRRRRGRRASRQPLDPFQPPGVDLRFEPELARSHAAPALRHGDLAIDPLAVFKPDGRSEYRSHSYPWRCVCRIQSGPHAGSGVLIGPRHVLTASHVIFWLLPIVNVSVNHFDNSNFGSSYAKWIYAEEQILDVNSDNVEEDWVVLVLDKPIGYGNGWLGSKEYDDDWDGVPYWRSMGYAADMNTSRPQRQNFITLHQEDGGGSLTLTTTDGDFMPMQSGSAVFSFWDAKPYVVGVCSGQTANRNWIAGGDDMVDLIIEARDDHP